MQVRRRVLVVTADSLSAKMAGPAIRAFEIASALHSVAEVTLVSTVHASIEGAPFPIVDVAGGGLRPLVLRSDVIVIQGHILHSYPWIEKTDKLIVADIYDPLHIEQLEQVRDLPVPERVAMTTGTVDVLNQQMLRADYMVCASEKQRDFWLGQLGSLGRINPATYDQDSSLRTLIDVVPFGLQDAHPVQQRHAIKGAVEGIGPDDKVILWGGGIYNWFDPLTLIRAVARLAERRPEVRLFFLGAQHPNPDVPAMKIAHESRLLARELGVDGTIVHFNEGWVPYDTRADYLLDADVGVSTHFDHLETAFSFRTRILDYLWCSLPIVSTDGDTFAELIARHDLGEVVPPDDVEALETALEALLFDDVRSASVRANVTAFAERFRWATVLQPLLEYCVRGQAAADRQQGITIAALAKIAGLEARIAGLETSASWRITAPIRFVTSRLRRLRGGSSDSAG